MRPRGRGGAARDPGTSRLSRFSFAQTSAPRLACWAPPPELGAVHLHGDRVRRAVGVPERELEELGGARRGVHGVLRGDGPAQCAGDALRLHALPVGGDDLQVPRVPGADALLSLRTTRGSGTGEHPLQGALPGPTPQNRISGVTTAPFLSTPG